MRIQCVRIIEFDAGHRVVNHESKCATLHGHRYKLEVFAEASELDSVGRVIDFSVIKKILGGWIDENWDHTCLIFKEDKKTLSALRSITRFKDPFPCEFNPTAENMAEFLVKDLCPKLFGSTGVTVTKVKLWETPNCYVEAFNEEV